MRRTVIDNLGAVQLGDEARALGYRPGRVVDVVRLSTGSLLVRLSDAPVLDVPARPLPAEQERPALSGGKRHAAS